MKGRDFLTNSFTYASLFSGIGGFEQALNKLGGQCVLASEIDKFARQSYTALYGDGHLQGDITKIEAKDVPDHDLLVGGFPCQAFSVAGKRKGFEDTRGTLFFEIVRIAKEKQPKVLLLENVKGLVNHDKGNTLNVMIQTLCEAGYTVDFEILNSKYFGVPQNRERIFIVAVRDDLVEQEDWKIEGTTIVPKGKQRIQKLEGVKSFNFNYPEQGEVTVRLRDILEADVDEKYYLSEDKTAKLVVQLEETTGKGIDEVVDAKVIQQAESGVRLREGSGTFRQCLNHQHVVERGIDNCDSVLEQYNKFVEREGFVPEMFNPYNSTEIIDVAPTQSAQCSRVNNSSTVLKIEPVMVGRVDLRGNDQIRRVYSPTGVAPTLTTMQGGHQEPKIAEEQEWWGEYESEEDEWRYEKKIREIRPVLTPDRINKRQNGRRFKENDEEAFTLTSQDRHGVAIEETPTKYRIRKLTPRECWRLQGFSDEAFNTVREAGLSDSQLYKQAGNAVTVNVVYEIGKNIIQILERIDTIK